VVNLSLGKELAKQIIQEHEVSIKLAYQVVGVRENCFRYSKVLSNENKLIEEWFLRITSNQKQWGFGLCFDLLRNVKSFKWNHKRVYRIYKEIEPNLRIKPKIRIKREKLEVLAIFKRRNEIWSMDFMSDNLTDGQALELSM
jgi:putative transposase